MTNSDNKGFSLVELIVSILIMSIVTGIIVILVSTSRRTYTEVKTEAVLQTESGIVKNFISEIAVEARKWGSSTDADGHDFIWMCAPDNEGTDAYFYYVFLHTDDDKLKYGKYDGTENGSLHNVTAEPGKSKKDFGTGFTFPSADVYSTNILDDSDLYSLLAEYVTSISCSSSNSEATKDLMTVNVAFSYNSHNYSSTMSFAGRNKISESE